MTGIIDIGSNTIRLVMYDKGKQVSNKGINSEIISDTEKGILTPDGIEKLKGQLTYLKALAGDTEVFAFATYAFRSLKNRDEVKAEILAQTGIEIDVLSGDAEAFYDFEGLISTLSKKESGVGIDLGGGSGQIMIFEKGELLYSASYPIGCRKVKNKFVKNTIPTSSEQNVLENYLEETLFDIKNTKIPQKKLYMMGGTAKTALKLYTFLKGTENINIIKTADMDMLISFIAETPPDTMKKILKNRFDNIIVGIMIMKKLAEIIGAAEIHIKKCGVRDGYLYCLKNNKAQEKI